MTTLTNNQRNLLGKLSAGDRIRRRYSVRGGVWFETTTPYGQDIEIGRLGKRGITANTLDSLVKRGYLTYNDAGLGSYERTDKPLEVVRS